MGSRLLHNVNFNTLLELHKAEVEPDGTMDYNGRFERKIANNTYSTVYARFGDHDEEPGGFYIRLHNSRIVQLIAPTAIDDGIVRFNISGWPTVTTRDRINRFLPDGWSLYTRSGTQHLSLRESYSAIGNPPRSITVPYSGWIECSQRTLDMGDLGDY